VFCLASNEKKILELHQMASADPSNLAPYDPHHHEAEHAGVFTIRLITGSANPKLGMYLPRSLDPIRSTSDVVSSW